VIVRLEHLRLPRGFGRRRGYCVRGARAWFERHGLDWEAFKREGIDSAALLATCDAFALALVEAVEAQQQDEGATDGR
jgi:hypothetical protein